MVAKKKTAKRRVITRRQAVAEFTITGKTSDFASLDRLRDALAKEKGIICSKTVIVQVKQRKRRVS